MFLSLKTGIHSCPTEYMKSCEYKRSSCTLSFNQDLSYYEDLITILPKSQAAPIQMVISDFF